MLVNTDIIPHIIHDDIYVSVLDLYDIKLYFKYWAIESVYQVVYTRIYGYFKGHRYIAINEIQVSKKVSFMGYILI